MRNFERDLSTQANEQIHIMRRQIKTYSKRCKSWRYLEQDAIVLKHRDGKLCSRHKGDSKRQVGPIDLHLVNWGVPHSIISPANFLGLDFDRWVALDFCPVLPRAQLVLPTVSFFLTLGNLYDIVSFWTREDKSDILPLQYKLVLIADIRRHVDIIYICCE